MELNRNSCPTVAVSSRYWARRLGMRMPMAPSLVPSRKIPKKTRPICHRREGPEGERFWWGDEASFTTLSPNSYLMKHSHLAHYSTGELREEEEMELALRSIGKQRRWDQYDAAPPFATPHGWVGAHDDIPLNRALLPQRPLRVLIGMIVEGSALRKGPGSRKVDKCGTISV
jgi:hypothetical protein